MKQVIGVIAATALISVVAIALIVSIVEAGGTSCYQQREILAAGMEAAVDSIDRGEPGLARRQLVEAAYDAGIQISDD